MTTTYQFPTDIVPQRAELALQRRDAHQQQALAGAVYRVTRSNALWRASIGWDVLPSVEKAQRIAAFCARIARGDSAAILVPKPYTRQGTGGGVLTVNGASQQGRSLVVANGAPNETVLAEGDRFVVNGELKITTAPLITDAAGAGVLEFEPNLRSSPADGVLLELEPWLACYLPSGGFTVSSRPGPFSGLSLELVELPNGIDETSGPWLDVVRCNGAAGARHPASTFARTGAAPYLNAAGLVVSASTDVARFEADDAGEILGVLIEPATTNLILRSAALDDAAWTKAAATITADAGTAPDGTATADKIVDTGSNAEHGVEQAIVKAASSLVYTVSAYVEASGRTWARLVLDDGAGTNGVRAWYNLTTGVVGTAAAFGSGFALVATDVVAMPSGRFRIVLTATTDATTAARGACYTATADAVTSYAGDGASGIFATWLQLEQRESATSYVATAGATASRNADSLSIATTELPISTTEGTIVVEAMLRDAPAGSAARVLFELGDGTANERLTVRKVAGGTDLDALVVDGGSTVVDIDGPAIVAGQVHKVALSWRRNRCRLAVDGVLIGSDAVLTLPTVTTLYLGKSSAGEQLGGWIRKARIYPNELELEDLLEATS